MQKRIWELDALRGLCVLGVVVVHLIYDLVELYEIIDWEYPVAYEFLQQWGGVLFLLMFVGAAFLEIKSIEIVVALLLLISMLAMRIGSIYFYVSALFFTRKKQVVALYRKIRRSKVSGAFLSIPIRQVSPIRMKQ